eukprot:905705-Rhodomonas_salina.1
MTPSQSLSLLSEKSCFPFFCFHWRGGVVLQQSAVIIDQREHSCLLAGQTGSTMQPPPLTLSPPSATSTSCSQFCPGRSQLQAAPLLEGNACSSRADWLSLRSAAQLSPRSLSALPTLSFCSFARISPRSLSARIVDKTF